ncbi:hypothetical protein [Stutzerimonas nitrititolerans]|uniref:hypothetical protein n=1 Tax=Stutzerimonas nitrititolerans TaxID=2482751 RepID=UPI0028AA6BA3|nr:hypothetical protein [Stutzerimonas nitrititolerans]
MDHAAKPGATRHGRVNRGPRVAIPGGVEKQQDIALSRFEQLPLWLNLVASRFQWMRGQVGISTPSATLEGNWQNGACGQAWASLRRAKQIAHDPLNAGMQAALQKAGDIKQ